MFSYSDRKEIRAGLVLLFLLGVIIFGFFLNWGNIPLEYHDWASINAVRLSFIQQALQKGQLPLHTSYPQTVNGKTDRFLVIPDLILSPQIILLRWLDIGHFFLAHILLLYTLGFVGLLLLRQRFKLPFWSFAMLFLFFFFNGHIISHLSAGHCTWGGYFLLPWFFLFTFRFFDDDNSWMLCGSMAFLLLLIFLQGSFHQFFWCLYFLGMLMIAMPSRWFTLLKMLLLSGLFCACRIAPILLDTDYDQYFFGGYPDLLTLIRSFVANVGIKRASEVTVLNKDLWWWEYDLFIGFAGCLLLLTALWCLLRQRGYLKTSKKYLPILLPVCVLVILSLGRSFAPFYYSSLPFFSSERVSSRFIILPVTLAFIIAARLLRNGIWRDNRWNVFLWAPLLVMAFEMLRHLYGWRVSLLPQAFERESIAYGSFELANHADADYFMSLRLGGIITLVSLLLTGGMIIRESCMNHHDN